MRRLMRRHQFKRLTIIASACSASLFAVQNTILSVFVGAELAEYSIVKVGILFFSGCYLLIALLVARRSWSDEQYFNAYYIPVLPIATVIGRFSFGAATNVWPPNVCIGIDVVIVICSLVAWSDYAITR